MRGPSNSGSSHSISSLLRGRNGEEELLTDAFVQSRYCTTLINTYIHIIQRTGSEDTSAKKDLDYISIIEVGPNPNYSDFQEINSSCCWQK